MNLNEKLKEFEESCLSLASKESEKLKDEITSELEEQMKNELDEYMKRKEWNFEKTIENLEKEHKKSVFYYQTDCKKEILKAKEEIENDLKKCVIKKLIDYTETNEYKEYLFKSIDYVLSNAEGNQNFNIGITENDYSKYKDEIVKTKNLKLYEISNSYIGGCILKSDSIFIDNTILANLEEVLKQENE